MEKIKRNKFLAALILVVAIAVISVLAVAIQKVIPSNKVMDLEKYYQVDSDKILIVLQNRIAEEQGLFIDGIAYVDYDTVKSTLDQRFYWDSNENILIYTTQSDVIKAHVGSKDYYVNKSKSSVPYQIVKTDGNKVYIALEFIRELSTNIEFETYKKPNRVVIKYDFKNDYLFSNVKDDTQLRCKPSIKSDILVQLKEGSALTYVDTEVVKGSKFRKVITEDGVIGYAKAKKLTRAKYGKAKGKVQHVEPVYTHITKDYTVSLGWHQVTNQDANNALLNVLEQSKGINTISPTWFSVSSVEGNITSLASERYVERAHNAGIEVWGLCDDFNKEINMLDVLSHTPRREKLENELIASAIKYNLDGLNIDFENITAKSAQHYIQFLRELSIKCRNNGIVLSVDNYVPAPYNSFYNFEVQGEVVDYLVVMAYDEHHAGSDEAGSVSSMGFFKDALDKTLKMVDKERVIMGLPFYTRLWTEKADGKISSAAYSMGQIRSLIDANGASIVWNEESGQNYAEYKTEDGLNKVWLEDDKSIGARMKIASDAGVAGMAYWKLGMEKASVWNVIQKFVN